MGTVGDGPHQVAIPHPQERRQGIPLHDDRPDPQAQQQGDDDLAGGQGQADGQQGRQDGQPAAVRGAG